MCQFCNLIVTEVNKIFFIASVFAAAAAAAPDTAAAAPDTAAAAPDTAAAPNFWIWMFIALAMFVL